MTTRTNTRHRPTRTITTAALLLTACGTSPSNAEVELPFR